MSTIKTVLDAHGYVDNLENVLSCLDSFVFAAYARTRAEPDQGGVTRVSEYQCCIRFELPQKNKVGDVLQSFYDEIAKYEAQVGSKKTAQWSPNPEIKALKGLKAELADLKAENNELRGQVSQLTRQLNREQKSLSRASRALDAQQLLPDNARIGRVDQIDLKQRLVQVKCNRKVIEIPTHMLDRVPEYQARCLVMLDESGETPVGVVFLDKQEWKDLEKRTAELLFVEGSSFKARDSMRNEFQIKAVNDLEAATIRDLSWRSLDSI